MDTPFFLCIGVGLIINSLAQQIEYTSQSSFTHGYGDTCACIHGIYASGQAVGGGHGDAAHNVIAKLACNLAHDFSALVLNFNSIKQIGEMTVFKLNIKYRTDYLYNLSDILTHLC